VVARRTYGDPCGVARSLDVIGERWALLIVRELLLGPKRFNDLLVGLCGASPNVISQRLRDLVDHGVVRRRDLGPPTRIHLYELTEWGRELEPAVLHLGRWGSQAPNPTDTSLGVDSLVLGLKAAFDPTRATTGNATVELHIDDHVFVVVLADGALSVHRGRADLPDATVTTDREALTAAAQGTLTLDDLLRTGALVIEGDQRASKLILNSSLAPPPTSEARAGAAGPAEQAQVTA
jgi:DNA-binding HxlR family transcriptional regulator